MAATGTQEGALRPELGQWFTPPWAAEALVDRFFPDLGLYDSVVEPSCGAGAFLGAVPDHVPAVGVEIDPAWAAHAQRCTGRQVLVGDFLTTDLPFRPTVILGNPPFSQRIIQPFLDRAWALLEDDGRAGFILPAYALQTASVGDRLAAKWVVEQDMLPRNLFPRLRLPICFARFTKGRKRGLVNFALYHEAVAVGALQRRYKALLEAGEGSVWAAVTQAALEHLGGRATLDALYREIEGARPTTNAFWKAKVRQTLQRIACRIGPGEWALAPRRLAVAA